VKSKVYILFIYLVVLTVLPSVRAVKLQFAYNCEQNCDDSEQNKCEKGKFVMSLNFSPLQIIKSYNYNLHLNLFYFELKKESTFYDAFVVSKFQNTIWHPPKYLL
jgi:hypothetical protein